MIRQHGFKPTNKQKEILQAGEIVILDTDFICKVEDLNWPIKRSISYKYEQRYQRERRNQKENEEEER